VSNKKHVVYVYGSLRPGNGDKYYIPGRIYTLGGFPAGKFTLNSDEDDVPTVVCERIEVSDTQLERLDQYEGYDEQRPETSLFIRIKCRDGWIYEYNSDTLKDTSLVLGGDWLAAKNQTRGHAFEHFLDEEVLKVTTTSAVMPGVQGPGAIAYEVA